MSAECRDIITSDHMTQFWIIKIYWDIFITLKGIFDIS